MENISDSEQIFYNTMLEKKAKEPWHLPVGDLINNRYIIGQAIGYGGFGVTYIAFDKILNQQVAIKEYLPSEFATRMPGENTVSVYEGERSLQFQHGLEGFIEEARKLARFSDYPGIVKVLGYFEENKTAYLVMEYIEGSTLKAYLRTKEGWRLTFEETLQLMLPIIDSLEEIHKVGIIHRDISPDNILISKLGEVKLIDFGAARYASTGATKSLSVILKPGYAPEEQYRSEGKQGPFSDVYAVAATMYTMLTGMVPPESLERTINDEIVPPSAVDVLIPKEAEIALMNGLAVKSYNRYQSMKDFRDYITGIKYSKVIDNGSKIARAYRFKRVFVRVIVVISIIGILSGGYLMYGYLQNMNVIERVSSDPNKSYVSDLVGLSKEEAIEILEKKSLNFLIVGKEDSDKVEMDKIMSQSPKAGALVEKQTVIEVVISGGEVTNTEVSQDGLVIVPDVQYQTEEEAKETIETMGLSYELVYAYSNDVKAGIVIEQDLEAGTEVEFESVIAVTISLGIEDIQEEVSGTEENEVPEVVEDVQAVEDIAEDIVEEVQETIESVQEVYRLNMSFDKEQLDANGADKGMVTIELLNSGGEVVSDASATIILSTTAGTFNSQTVLLQEGRAQATLTSEYLMEDVEVVVTASITDSSIPDTNGIQVSRNITMATVEEPAYYFMEIYTDMPDLVMKANPSAQTMLTVMIVDANYAPVSFIDGEITFSTNYGTIQSPIRSLEYGQANTVFKSQYLSETTVAYVTATVTACSDPTFIGMQSSVAIILTPAP